MKGQLKIEQVRNDLRLLPSVSAAAPTRYVSRGEEVSEHESRICQDAKFSSWSQTGGTCDDGEKPCGTPFLMSLTIKKQRGKKRPSSRVLRGLASSRVEDITHIDP